MFYRYLILFFIVFLGLINSNIFGQKVKIKKGNLLIDKQKVRTITEYDKGLVIRFVNESSSFILKYDSVESLTPNFKLHKPIKTEIKLSNSLFSGESKNRKKANEESIKLLLEKGILTNHGKIVIDSTNLIGLCEKGEISFSVQRKQVHHTINDHTIKISEIDKCSGDNQLFEEIYRITNGRTEEFIDVERTRINGSEKYISELKVEGDRIIIERSVKKIYGGTEYATDKVLIDEKGKPYEDRNNGKYKSQEIVEDETAPKDIERTIFKNASFPGGQKALMKWVNRNFDPIQFESFLTDDVNKIRIFANFIIDEKGKVTNVKTTSRVMSETGLKLAKEKISKMPFWSPAEYENGDKAKQSFSLPIFLVIVN